MKNNLLKKLTSRKFIVTAITAIAGIVTLIVGDNAIVQVIAGAAMTIIPTVVYCIMEGNIDAKSIKTIADTTADTAEKLGASNATVEVIEQIGTVGQVLVDTDDGK